MLVAPMLRLRSGVLPRLVVFALLLWAATDLAFPQLCAEDSVIASSQGGAADRAADQADDCFCCCHHVVPVTISFTAVPAGVIDLANARPSDSLLGTARPVFHPPLSV